MANAFYPKFKEQMLQAGVNLSSGDVKLALLTSAYTYSSAHEFVSDLTNILTDGRSPALSSKTFTDGVFDAADVTLPSVTGSQTAAAIVFYIDSGSDATSRLICFLDTNVTGFPFSTNGNDVTVTFDSGANRIFAFAG